MPSRQRADAPAGGPLGLLQGEGTHRPREFTYPPEPHRGLERAEGRLRDVLGVERAEGRVCER